MLLSHKHSSRWRVPRQRRGAATVELAVCLPLLATIVFGSIQACNMLYLRHAVLSSAYQGSLEAAHPDATTASITQSVQNMLTVRGVSGATISVSHWNNSADPAAGLSSSADFLDYPRGTRFTVHVSAPMQANLMKPHWLVPPSQVDAEVTSMK
jgi:Flp pilus assembly protein TadG